MNHEASIQHKPTRTALIGSAFDDAGEQVPFVGFDYDAIDESLAGKQAGPDAVCREDREYTADDLKRAIRESAMDVLWLVTGGLEDPEDMGRRALMALYQSGEIDTLAGLAERMHVTKGRACQLYQEFKKLNGKTPIKTGL